jgi:hypothetical protein
VLFDELTLQNRVIYDENRNKIVNDDDEKKRMSCDKKLD